MQQTDWGLQKDSSLLPFSSSETVSFSLRCSAGYECFVSCLSSHFPACSKVTTFNLSCTLKLLRYLSISAAHSNSLGTLRNSRCLHFMASLFPKPSGPWPRGQQLWRAPRRFCVADMRLFAPWSFLGTDNGSVFITCVLMVSDIIDHSLILLVEIIIPGIPSSRWLFRLPGELCTFPQTSLWPPIPYIHTQAATTPTSFMSPNWFDSRSQCLLILALHWTLNILGRTV